MARKKALEIVRVKCPNCGGANRNHAVLTTTTASWESPHGDVQGGTAHQICKCQGCDRICFREVSWNSDDIDHESGEPLERSTVYPEPATLGREAVDATHVPEQVADIYQQTIAALNAGAHTLAGGGLRAIVEAICLDQNVKGKNLGEKIDKLASTGSLAQRQADLLHEERYLGNAALHELARPSSADLRDGFEIIEGLLKTLYVLPKHAERLRKRRPAKKA